MDKQIIDFINGLVEKCAANPALADKKEDLEAYFYRLMIETLIDNLTEDQVNQIKDMDLKSPEAQEKMMLFSAQIPGFIFILDEKLQTDAENIAKSGRIPS